VAELLSELDDEDDDGDDQEVSAERAEPCRFERARYTVQTVDFEAGAY